MASVPSVRVVRSGLVESVHLADVAVCDADGRLVAFAGEAGRPVYGRSCTKPLQASVSLAAIGDEPLSDRQIAIACASHNGEPVHLAAVRSVLRRGGLGVDALRTPPGWPLDPATMARARTKTPLRHNCSGKHAGMLLACVRRGWNLETYRRPGHPLQRRVLAAVEAATGHDRVHVGVDGCGVPVHGVPLAGMATMFARLASPDRLGDLAAAAARATAGMRAAPYLVGGRARLDTDLMSAVDGLVVKDGAEALICAAVVPQGLGVAVRVAEGGDRATGPLLIEALRQLDAIDAAQVRRVAAHAAPAVLGGGAPVGRLEVDLRLRRR
ncbi:MAG: asparaginase [Actinomycetota bacterium]